MNKILTIATVCYNSEKTIKDCVNSVVTQLTDEVEYIIIDGASKDKTVKIINSFNNKNIKLISEKDNGIYDAMNKALYLSKGKYILYLNSDDELVEGVIKKLIPILKKSKKDILYGDIYLRLYKNNNKYIRLKKYNNDFNDIRKACIIHHQATFTKVKKLQEINGFNLKYKITAEWDSFIRLYDAGVSFEYLDMPISYFSIDGISSSGPSLSERFSIRKKNIRYMYKFYEDLRDVLIMKIKYFLKKIGYDIDLKRIENGYYQKITKDDDK